MTEQHFAKQGGHTELMAQNKDSEKESKIRQLIELLEFEISRIRHEERRHGWSIWALYGALATIGWLIFAEIEAHTPNINNFLLTLLTALLSFDLIDSFRGVISPSQEQSKSYVRFREAKKLSANLRLSGVLVAVRYVGLLLIAVINPLTPSGLIKFVIVSYCFSILLLLLFIFWMGLTNKPIPTKLHFTGWWLQIVPIAFLIALGIGTVGLVTRLVQIGVPISEIRLGALTSIGLTCLLLLSHQHQEPPLVSTLVDVRRKIGLNQLNYDDAKKQTEIALNGLAVADVLQAETDEILSIFRKAAIKHKEADQELLSLESILPDDFRLISEEQKTLINATARSMQSQMEEVTDALKRVGALFERLSNKGIFLFGMAPQALADVKSLFSRLDAERAEGKRVLESFNERLKNFIDKVEPWM